MIVVGFIPCIPFRVFTYIPPIHQFPFSHFESYYTSNFPNLNPIFLLVYFHESSYAVPSIRVVFQDFHIFVLYSSTIMHYIPICYSTKPASNIRVIVPCVFQSFSIVIHYWIPVFPWLFLRSLFSFSNTPNVLFSQFLSCLFLCFLLCFLLSKFLLFHSSLYYSCARSIFRLPSFYFQVFRFHATYLTFFAVFPLCVRRHLQDGTQNPSIGRLSGVVLALPACRQFPVLPI